MRSGTNQVRFVIPEELADRLEELAKQCGVPAVKVVCVGLRMTTDIAQDRDGLRDLQERAPLLKPDRPN